MSKMKITIAKSENALKFTEVTVREPLVEDLMEAIQVNRLLIEFDS